MGNLLSQPGRGFSEGLGEVSQLPWGGVSTTMSKPGCDGTSTFLTDNVWKTLGRMIAWN